MLREDKIKFWSYSKAGARAEAKALKVLAGGAVNPEHRAEFLVEANLKNIEADVYQLKEQEARA